MLGLRFAQVASLVVYTHLATVACSNLTEYKIGIWYSTSEERIMDMYKPLFEDYLNRVVESSLNVRFKVVVVDLDETMLVEDLIDAGELDLLFSNAGRIACVERAFGWFTIATARISVLGHDTGAHGTLIYSLKANSAVNNLRDLKNKRIGLPLVHSPEFVMGKQALQSHGVSLFKDAKQLVFYDSRYADQLLDVLKRKIDVGIVSSSFLFQEYPDRVPYLRFLNVVNASWESEPFPLPASAPLAPAFTIASAPVVPNAVKGAVRKALMRLEADMPEARAAGISTFTPPASHFRTLKTMEVAGLVSASGRCTSPFRRRGDVLRCPKGTVADSPRRLEASCEDKGIPCPDGLPCFCDPCVAGSHSVELGPEVLLGLAAALFGLNIVALHLGGLLLEAAARARRAAGRLAKKARDAFLWWFAGPRRP